MRQIVKNWVGVKTKEMREAMATFISRDLYATAFAEGEPQGVPAELDDRRPKLRQHQRDHPSDLYKSYKKTGATADQLLRDRQEQRSGVVLQAKARQGMHKVTHVFCSGNAYNELERIWLAQGGPLPVWEQEGHPGPVASTVSRGATSSSCGISSWTTTTADQNRLYGIDSNSLRCIVNPEGTSEGVWDPMRMVGFPGAIGRISMYTGQNVLTRRRTSFRLEGTATAAQFNWQKP